MSQVADAWGLSYCAGTSTDALLGRGTGGNVWMLLLYVAGVVAAVVGVATSVWVSVTIVPALVVPPASRGPLSRRGSAEHG